ncbi:C6 domain-containing protein [Caenorhabditis elegans]|uniref:C6 domain-containing protein n=1 Tax=Caenorhabditis elegans TaxID=6239 RepID=Q3V5H8_CAEEL|nr:C6 domain-containing protein [Caenorhabditis elegans]CCD63497.1 C6 domain-containing protein [Caenorhabditis elegans]|eukprot:NP_001033337.1 Uncharacterized protein CELE_K02E7.1 [Caenorhabditis elegans]
MRHLILSLTIFSTCIAIVNSCAATSGTTSPVTVAPVTPTGCNSCTADLIGIKTGADGDFPPTSVIGTVNGCRTITYTCQRTPPVATDVVQITYYSDSRTDPASIENGVGVVQALSTASAVIDCVDGHWEKDTIEINDIECQIIT